MPENTKTRSPIIKDFVKRAEAIGFNIAYKNVLCNTWNSEPWLQGVSFTCDVDVVKFIDSIDTDGTQFPRTREKFKEGDFKIRIIKISDEAHSETMQVSIEDSIKDESDDLKDALGSTLEGKPLPDKIAELGELILEKARSMADELYKELKEGGK